MEDIDVIRTLEAACDMSIHEIADTLFQAAKARIPHEDIKIKYWPQSPHLEVNPNGSWIDLYTYEDVTLQAGEYTIIPLGVAMKLPEGYEANFVPRSSTFKRYGVIQTNHFSVIDPTYCGDDDMWGYPVYATRPVCIPKGTRLCQFRINKVQPTIFFEEVEHLNAESRGGWGTSN